MFEEPDSEPPSHRRWLLGCAGTVAGVLVIGLGALAYLAGHADQEPKPNQAWSAQTFAQTPAFPATGSGDASPPTVSYRITSPLDDHLSVELRSDAFTWVPVAVAGSGQPSVHLARFPGGCPGAAAPGMACPPVWLARYTLASAGPVTISWDLLADPPPTIEAGFAVPPPTVPPAPGRPCPASLPVPLTPVVEGCVVATATIAVDVPSSPAPTPSPPPGLEPPAPPS